VATCAGVVGCPNTVVNVGRVDTRGMEAAASWAIRRHWTWFNSLTLNRSRYGSDYLDKGAIVAVGGKEVVDTPSRLMHSELGFDNKRWFARLGARYTSKRYYTYTNDGQVPSFTVWDLGTGIHHGALTFQVNVNNLFDKRYFSTIGSNQFAASDPRGTFATLLTGAPRELFFTVSGKLK
jgi:iron complex outermembrane receptor protein